VVGPAICGVIRLLAAVPGVTALRTKRALGNHSRVLAEQRERYGVTHDLVDTAPARSEAHPAAA